MHRKELAPGAVHHPAAVRSGSALLVGALFALAVGFGPADSGAETSASETRLPGGSPWRPGTIRRGPDGRIILESEPERKPIGAGARDNDDTPANSNMPESERPTRTTDHAGKLEGRVYTKIWQDRSEHPKGDYIPGEIGKSGLAATLVDFITVPDSRTATSSLRPRRARLGQIRPAYDRSGRLFVNDLRGKLYVVKAGVLLRQPFLDLTGVRPGAFTDKGAQQGLTGFAFHPDFANSGRPGNGKVFTAHTERPDAAPRELGTPVHVGPNRRVVSQDVIVEWQIDPDNPDRLDPGSAREIFRIVQPSGQNVQQLAFNPNATPGEADYGMLYIGVGSIGYPGPGEQHLGQNTRTWLGKILRIDPLGDESRSYGIPADNPFVGDAAFLPEIWAYGLRNPQRFSWDSGGVGRMLIADIGQALIEEINLGVAGANYGWSKREGTFVHDRRDNYELFPLPADDDALGLTYPVAQYDHDEGRAVSGGFVYRGRDLPYLYGKYIFGDIVNGRVFHIDVERLAAHGQTAIGELTLYYNGVPATLLDIVANNKRADLRFGIDAAGEILIMTQQDGVIRRLAPAPNLQN